MGAKNLDFSLAHSLKSSGPFPVRPRTDVVHNSQFGTSSEPSKAAIPSATRCPTSANSARPHARSTQRRPRLCARTMALCRGCSSARRAVQQSMQLARSLGVRCLATSSIASSGKSSREAWRAKVKVSVHPDALAI